MARVNLFFLHGFLGKSSDWALVKSHLSLKDGTRVFSPDYFKEPQLGPQHDFKTWAKNFNAWVESLGCAKERNVLIGYSLGGRLALHAFENQPELWSKLVAISSNPGFDDNLDSFDPNSIPRKERWLNDSFWAEEFLKSPWDSVIKSWNAQPVFGQGDKEPLRIEKEYSREQLSLALTQWSLALQKNFRSLLEKSTDQVALYVGEQDEKYMQMAAGLKESIPQLRIEVIEEASHRVLFDNPKALATKLARFIF